MTKSKAHFAPGWLHPVRFNTTPAVLVAVLGGAMIAAWTAQVTAGNVLYVGKPTSAELSMEDMDHQPWNRLLTKHVDPNGLVNYQQWKAASADVQSLDRYLSHLSDANPTAPATREAKLAFWINAYNAVTVRGILREYPTTSIRNHTAKLWGYNIWHDLQLHVGGKPYSLDQIEHQVLRKMGEPRIHFAIVCASIGCPRLLNAAYQADQLEAQLELNAKDFFSRKQNFRHDVDDQRFHLSAIMNWFGADFGDDQRSRLSRIANWLPTATAIKAANTHSVSVSYLDYDWKLNQQ